MPPDKDVVHKMREACEFLARRLELRAASLNKGCFGGYYCVLCDGVARNNVENDDNNSHWYLLCVDNVSGIVQSNFLFMISFTLYNPLSCWYVPVLLLSPFYR